VTLLLLLAGILLALGLTVFAGFITDCIYSVVRGDG
jgi:hypothetical protein